MMFSSTTNSVLTIMTKSVITPTQYQWRVKYKQVVRDLKKIPYFYSIENFATACRKRYEIKFIGLKGNKQYSQNNPIAYKIAQEITARNQIVLSPSVAINVGLHLMDTYLKI